MKENMNKYEFIYVGKNEKEYEIDKIITKKTFEHLHEFFNKKNQSFNSTRKNTRKISIKNRSNKVKTRKIIY